MENNLESVYYTKGKEDTHEEEDAIFNYEFTPPGKVEHESTSSVFKAKKETGEEKFLNNEKVFVENQSREKKDDESEFDNHSESVFIVAALLLGIPMFFWISFILHSINYFIYRKSALRKDRYFARLSGNFAFLELIIILVNLVFYFIVFVILLIAIIQFIIK